MFAYLKNSSYLCNMKNEKYEWLYDSITNVTIAISEFRVEEVCNFCGPETTALLDKLDDVAGELQEIAHELEQHYTWD